MNNKKSRVLRRGEGCHSKKATKRLGSKRLRKTADDRLRDLPELEVAYAVPWIEVEFGQRDEGHKLFLNLARCKRTTLKDSDEGACAGGYIGPERPLHCFEVPLASLEEEYVTDLLDRGVTHTENHWSRLSGVPYTVFLANRKSWFTTLLVFGWILRPFSAP